ncbi:MAG: hypothetical protein BGO21_20465 [Dyadobacter sp. 50-39]|uniref:hypothetical protein n=1 Tax=Dyadobacter sp. 50-39 TaxID=1895756 RepID=UPI000965BFE8|nr:hypothetical protein [Dyadobacter sp. 50-39]OJV13996.1 MAG: hypothetical protein BGO21_20465 [Dyadobacter sp. 50-39]
MRTNLDILTEIRQLHKKYITEIDTSDLKPLSAKIYKTHSENFIRWIEGDFQPGQRTIRRNQR